MIPTRFAGDEEVENRRNVTERHCRIGKVVRTPKGERFDRGVPPMKQVGEFPAWYDCERARIGEVKVMLL